MSLESASAPQRNTLLRRKPVGERSHADGPELSRTIGTFQLMMFGVGATVGTGIFFVMSAAVPEAGPAVVVSFVLAGLAAGLAAICYAEMASSVPVSGSTYSYAYATLGEIKSRQAVKRGFQEGQIAQDLISPPQLPRYIKSQSTWISVPR